MPKPEQVRIAVIGGGPIGLEAALAARLDRFSVKVYERGKIGEHLQRWGHVRLFSPFSMNCTDAGREAILAEHPSHSFPEENACITGRQHLATYLEPLSKSKLLRECLCTDTQVLAIGRQRWLKSDSPGNDQRAQQAFRLLVREKGKERIEEADVVLDCSGVYGQHRWLGDGGIPAPGELAAEQQIVYGLDDVLGDRRNYYAGKTILVVGGGYSAATTVCNLAELAQQSPETWTIWLARTTATQPIRRIVNDSLRERDRLAVRANTLATRADGNVEFHGNSVVRAIEPLGPDKGFRVSAMVGKQLKTWDVDRLVGNVGYTPDTNVYRELQVHECYASLGPMKLAAALLGAGAGDCLQQTSHGAEALRNPEPNFYVLGSKSYGRNSHFLLRIGFEQVEEVLSLIRKDFR
jgi:thioredoxin reductase